MKGEFNHVNKKTVEDLKDIKGKKVLVRATLTYHLKMVLFKMKTVLLGALPTIKNLWSKGAKVILCSHLGKPKRRTKTRAFLEPVAKSLSKHLGIEVKFANDDTVVGENAKAMASSLKDGEVMLLQNTRYRVEETKYGKDEAAEAYAKELASTLRQTKFL